MELTRTTEETVDVEFTLSGNSLEATYQTRDGRTLTQTIAEITPEGIEPTGWVQEDLPLPRQDPDNPNSAVRTL